MNQEQQHFDELEAKLKTCKTSDRADITAAMDTSQAKLTEFMEKATLCLSQEPEPGGPSQDEPNVQTHVTGDVESSQTSTKSNSQANAPQPAEGMSVINNNIDNKTPVEINGIYGKPPGVHTRDASEVSVPKPTAYPWTKTNTAKPDVVSGNFSHVQSNASNSVSNQAKPSVGRDTSKPTANTTTITESGSYQAEFEKCLKVSFARSLFENKDSEAKGNEVAVKARPSSWVEPKAETGASERQAQGVMMARSTSNHGVLAKAENKPQVDQNTDAKLAIKSQAQPKFKSKTSANPTVRKSWDTKTLLASKQVQSRDQNDITHSSKTSQSASSKQTDEVKTRVSLSHNVHESIAHNVLKKSEAERSVSGSDKQDSHSVVERKDKLKTQQTKQVSQSQGYGCTGSQQTKSGVQSSAREKSVQQPSQASRAIPPPPAPPGALARAPVSVQQKLKSGQKSSDAAETEGFQAVLQQIRKFRAPSPGAHEGGGQTNASPVNIKHSSEATPRQEVKAAKQQDSDTSTSPGASYASKNITVPSPVLLSSQPDGKSYNGDEIIKDKVTLKGWDPTVLLEDLYRIRLAPDTSPDGHAYINIEGYMEKLPMNKKKATLLKTWKKRYFKAIDGCLYYYETEDLDKSALSLPLAGGAVEDLGTNILGLDDGRGRYLMVRCVTEHETQRWLTALQSQIAAKSTIHWIKPLVNPNPHPSRSVVILDLGSCSVRAGVLGSHPSLPALFFPTAVAVDDKKSKEYVGIEAFHPEARINCKVTLPVKPSVKVDKFQFDMNVFPALMRKVFDWLKVDPKKHWVLVSAPGSVGDKTKESMLNTLITQMGVQGVCVADQTLLALYAYGARSGIVVDIGERLDIMPVTDGYIVKQGHARQPYGGARICDALNGYLTETRYHFFTDVERLIVRMALEKSCFVAKDFKKTTDDCNIQPHDFQQTISLEEYLLPKGTWTEVTHDMSRFKAVEGLFNLHVWGMDNPSLPKLVLAAVQASPLDARREMWRSIYLSGGVSLLPGFQERLQLELEKLAPSSVTVEVHASPQRYHAAFIGACALANMEQFENWCVTSTQWKNQGVTALHKWHN